jgi:hypothetical protein
MLPTDDHIPGIYNYCDRWCETCAFTSRCGVFADVAETQAALDPNFRAIVEAPALPQDEPPPPSPEMQAWIDELNDITREALENPEPPDLSPTIPEAHEPMLDRAHGYGMGVHRWVQAHFGNEQHPASDPRSIVAWDGLLIGAKVHRALDGLARGWDIEGIPPDHDGSAKVALLSIDRSHAAWLRMIECGHTTMAEAAQFIEDLVWLGTNLEETFPEARKFVRPGFDE